MTDALPWLLLVALGGVTGVVAGLFGIGGGLLVVPGLVLFFSWVTAAGDHLMHVAAGTSLAIMVATSISSMRAHQKYGNIQWPLFRAMVVPLMLGTAAGTALGALLSTRALKMAFGLLLLWVAYKMFAGRPPLEQQARRQQRAVLWPAGGGIGVLSGLLGVGGGTVSIPFLCWTGVVMKQAVATSAAFTLPISCVGALAALATGWHAMAATPGMLGFVYWPAVLCVAPGTLLGAPLGARLATTLPARGLRRAFAALLVLVGVKMMLP